MSGGEAGGLASRVDISSFSTFRLILSDSLMILMIRPEFIGCNAHRRSPSAALQECCFPCVGLDMGDPGLFCVVGIMENWGVLNQRLQLPELLWWIPVDGVF